LGWRPVQGALRGGGRGVAARRVQGAAAARLGREKETEKETEKKEGSGDRFKRLIFGG
jgi:hypothetical protein